MSQKIARLRCVSCACHSRLTCDDIGTRTRGMRGWRALMSAPLNDVKTVTKPSRQIGARREK
eukprot:276128-Prymnesium_polylepis.1